MEIREFQKRLAEVVELAKYNGKRLKPELVEHLFEDEGLSGGQMERVYEYLRAQGIRIGDGEEEQEQAGFVFEEEREPDALSAEEERCLEEYRTAFSEAAREWRRRKEKNGASNPAEAPEGGEPGKEPGADEQKGTARRPDAQKREPEFREGAETAVSEKEREALFAQAAGGDREAVRVLASLYTDEVIRAVRELHRKEIFAGDSFQEGNLGLMTALAGLDGQEDPHGYVCRSIRSAITAMMREVQEQKWEDACLVDRVERLEQAIRELADGSGDKFSVEELSAFLDMSVEEIQDILRLTGDED